VKYGYHPNAQPNAALYTELSWETVFEESPLGMAVTDPDGLIVRANPAWRQLLGLTEEDLTSISMRAITHPDDWPIFEAALQGALSVHERSFEVEQRYRCRDGHEVWVRASATMLRGGQSERSSLFWQVHSIGAPARAQQVVDAEISILEMVARGTPLDDTLSAITKMVEAQSRYGICAALLLEEGDALRQGAAPNMPREYWRAIDGLAVGPGGGACGIAAEKARPTTSSDFTRHTSEPFRDLALASGVRCCWSFPILGPHSRALGTLSLYRSEPADPTPGDWEILAHGARLAAIAIERKNAENQLARQALHDPLTGLPNRVLLLDRIGHALARLERRHVTVAVLFLDLDRFKVVNDTLGHEAGDRLLVELAYRIERSLRRTDTPARLGGDEFAVLCEEVRDRQDALGIAQNLARTVAEPFTLEGEEVFLTTSIGIALCPSGSSTSPEVLLRNADSAMYRAKELGKARCELYEDSASREISALSFERALERAIEQHELRVFYQPEVSLETGQVVGAEALARWEHPEKGLMPAAHFIAAAEESGLILQIGAFVLEEACRHIARLQGQRDGLPALCVGVNLSARQLADPDLQGVVSRALRSTGTDPATLCFEIAESVLMDGEGASVGALEQLRSLGVKVGVDNFGTGYASLSYLTRLPVDFLKLDRCFVTGLGRHPSDTAIVSTVINLAGALGLTTVAEGVETPGQLQELRALGCDIVQGFHLARPQPGHVLDVLLDGDPRW
jgi:diguanylate cyclase (GGDEF)-like protein/PAS domain S-box-containing protein